MAHQDNRNEDAAAGPADAAEGPPPLWEWLIAGLGLLLVLASLAYLTVQALAPATPPDPVVELVAVHEQQDRYLAVVRVRNRGRQTAEALQVAGVLRQGDAVLERSETQFEFVPGGSAREGGLFFRHDPRAYALELRPESYQAP